MKDFKFIPYDKKLVLKARELRREATEAEKLFWTSVLKDNSLAHLKFTRQKPLGHFIADFYCATLRLVIEVDGEVHTFQKARDRERDTILSQKFDLTVIRYTNEEVLEDVEKVKEDLMRRIKKSP